MHCAVLALVIPALLPDAALVGMRPASHPSISAAAASSCRSAVLHMVEPPPPRLAPVILHSGDDDVDDASSPSAAAAAVGWRERTKNACVTLATAAMLAIPSGSAVAAEMPAPTAVSKHLKGKAANSKQRLAFLGFRKKRKHSLVPSHIRGPTAPNEIDMGRVVSKRAAKKYTERSFIFSDALTAKSALEDELEQLDEDANDRKLQKTASTFALWGGAGAMVYGTIQGLQGIERWMKRQEEKDIEDEMELTGQYVSVDAGDVESVIDPKTGKNITIAKRDKPKPKDGDLLADGTNATSAAPPKQAPWLLRKLGLDGVASAADDDDFWVGPEAQQSIGPSGGPGAAPGTGGAPGDAPPSGDGSGGDGGGGGGDGGGDDGLEDDSSDIDEIDDLLG